MASTINAEKLPMNVELTVLLIALVAVRVKATLVPIANIGSPKSDVGICDAEDSDIFPSATWSAFIFNTRPRINTVVNVIECTTGAQD
jgi:hypothetical protein